MSMSVGWDVIYSVTGGAKGDDLHHLSLYSAHFLLFPYFLWSLISNQI